MNPLSALYGAAVRVRNELYDRGLITVQRLQGPVVSIGNLTVGGSGKTPFLILLGELLKQRGVSFDVLSRGYRRQTQGVAIIDPSGSARDFGDEPLLMARQLGVHVVVGEDRHEAGEMAEASFGPQLHLLDDGFQHRQLARDFDIVLVTPTDTQDSLLPAGRLREPIASLARADAIVLTNNTSADGLRLQNQLVWRVRRDIDPPETLNPCFAFCGIARPENFFAQLQAAQVV
ncbi:MAG TPA: tetraacyldisaccharide 4'-kinase, partial [Terriglobales bacterium]|nr:tetraacyldisaccharide 4'-kinase [Terriglobales bacterium]